MSVPESKLPIGKRILFTKTLIGPACEEHPTIMYAMKGEKGEVVGYNAREGYMVKRDGWPAPFGAEYEKEFIAI